MPDLTVGTVLEATGGSIKTGPFGTKLSASEYTTHGAPVISVGEVGYGSIKLSDRTKRVGSVVTDRMPEYLLAADDIVFGRKGAVDRSARVRAHESGYFLGSDGIRLRFGQGVDSRFMAYQLQSERVRHWILRHAVGTTLASLNEPTLKAVPVSVPPLEEQRAIAAVLGSLDDKIESNHGLARQCAELVDAIATMLLNSASAKTALADVVDFNLRTVKPGPPDAALTYIDIASVSPGSVDPLTPIKWNDAPSRARRGVVDGDVIYSTVRPGRRSYVQILEPSPGTVASTGFAILSPTSRIGSSLLTTIASSLEFARYLESVAHGSAYPAVSVEAMGAFDVRLPSAEDVAAFETRTMPLRRRAHRAKLENEHLAALRDALLPELLSGRIRVTEQKAG